MIIVLCFLFLLIACSSVVSRMTSLPMVCRVGCRRLGEKPVGRKTFGRIIFWATDDWATTVISEKTFRPKTVGRQ